MINGLLKSIAAAALCCTMLASCAGNTAQSLPAESGSKEETVELTPPFWVVKDSQSGGVLYLLGSMHVGKDNAVYPDYVMEAYRQCDTVAAELDTVAANSDLQASIDALQHIMCKNGTTAADCFGEDYDRVRDFFEEKNQPLYVLDYYMPYYWASSISVAAAADAGLDAQCGTESYFLDMAHEDGKYIAEIESLGEQYEMMGKIAMPLQVQLVLECVGDESYQLQVESIGELYNAWSTFDEQYLEQLDGEAIEIPEGVSQEDFDEYMSLMYYDRQENMGEAAVKFLKNGGAVFMFVGTAHFYIEDDIITYIENAGYTVNPVRGDN